MQTESVAEIESRRRLVGLAVLCVFVTALIYASGTFGAATQRIPAVWPMNAILLGFSLRLSTRRAVLFILATAVVLGAGYAIFAEPPVFAAALALANAIELAAATAALRRLHVFAGPAPRGRQLIELAAWAAIFGPFVGATAAATVLSMVSGGEFLRGWATWFFAEVLGMLTLGPATLLVRRREALALLSRPRRADALITLGIVAAVDVFVFEHNRYPLLFVAFPMLVVTAFRLGLAGAAVAVPLSAAIAVAGSYVGAGPLAAVSLSTFSDGRILVQAYVAIVTLMAIPVAIVLDERRLLHLERDERLAALAESRKRLEEQQAELIRMAEAARAATRAKSEFLATLSHELRTPMTGVLGMVELLRDEPEGPEREQMLDTLQSSTRSLLGVIGDVLDFSKIEAGKLTMESVEMRVCEIARGVVDLFVNSASGKNVALDLEFGGDTERDLVMSDPTRIRQVLSNLVGNALKFTASGGVRVRVEAEIEHDLWTFSVSDTGIGIDAQAQATLFEAFTQADASTTRRFGGTGLGLTISKRIVEALGGEITLESVPNVGSTFRFSLVLRQARRRETAPVQKDDPFAPSPLALRVLVAEDNVTNQMLVRKMLERMGHAVACAGDGRRALAAVQDDAFDVVLMDMHMPEMDGAAATRAIRALDGPTAKIPVIALTADAIAEHRRLFEEAGLDGFLTKPIDPMRLRLQLDRIVARKTAAASAAASCPAG